MNWRIVHEPLSQEEIALLQDVPEHEFDDEFRTPEGREFRMSYDRRSIVEIGSKDAPMRFASVAALERGWVDLQALLGIKSRLAADPDWGTVPPPTVPTIQ